MSTTVPVQSATGKDFPLSEQNITQGYRVANKRYKTGYHTGVDYAATIGTPVFAAEGGTVEQVLNTGRVGYGKQILIHDSDGTYELYGHLSTAGSLKAGDVVETGTQIALSGNTGNSTGPHLHFEVRNGINYGTDIDPIGWLNMPAKATTPGGTVTPTGFNKPNAQGPTIQPTLSWWNPGNLIPGYEGITTFFQIITDGQFWIRVFEIAGGILFIMFAIWTFVSGSINPIDAVSAIKK